MKQKKFNSHGLLLFLVLILITTSNNSARNIASKQGEPNSKITNNNSLTNLMGLDECQNEKCLTRRVLEEAHLDYIYTQHHDP